VVVMNQVDYDKRRFNADEYGNLISRPRPKSKRFRQSTPGQADSIKVEVRGGIAYCDDPRVEIIDHDYY